MKVSVIQNNIYEVRGEKVMLDFDIAELYDVETKALNQAVKRNSDRFPRDFMFRVVFGSMVLRSSSTPYMGYLLLLPLYI